MSDSPVTNFALEVHDPEILSQARAVLDTCRSGKEMQDAVIAAVKRNEKWRGEQCINLLAPEAPTSLTVRALLSTEVGTRAAEGHIGRVNRWFAGTKYIDEIEALCVELLKHAFRVRYADHRLVASMIGNLAVYTALTEPGAVIMSIAQPFGGHSSNRVDGPAGVRGLRIVDVPMYPDELVVDLDLFRALAPLVRPKLVALGASMTLFPFPLNEMSEMVAEWGGKLFFDGAHKSGLIAGGQFQDPLREGAVVMTGSAGKTFSGPQSGIIVWDDPSLTQPITHAIFPVLAATHQVNRVAALAVAAAEMIEFGQTYMAQVVFAVFAVVSNHYHVIERASSYSSGPPTGFTGAPDERDCTACHLGPALTGQFSILAPPSYVPGRTYLVRVRHTTTDDTRKRWGFQMTSLSGQLAAGSFVSLGPATQVLTENERSYAEHTQAGDYAGQLGGAEWAFSWTAPPSAMGPISFWAAGIQANRANGPDGDQVYTTSAVITVGSPTPTPSPPSPACCLCGTESAIYFLS